MKQSGRPLAKPLAGTPCRTFSLRAFRIAARERVDDFERTSAKPLRATSIMLPLDPAPEKPASSPEKLRREKEFVLSKCRYFVDAQVWPIQELNPEGWLDNFEASELPFAVHLLNQFQYFSKRVTNALLEGALMEMSRHLVPVAASADTAGARWEDFLGSVIVTYPTGEKPRATDSGHTFARMARQILEFPESRILGPAAALEYLLTNGPRPVLFVDDFLGTGRQFVTTWHREYEFQGEQWSFETAQEAKPFSAYYLPLVAATQGMSALQQYCPKVQCLPAHALPDEYSALHPESFIWPSDAREAGQQMIQQASVRAGVPETNGQSDKDWQGFGKLGLCIAFEHGVPDATLPLFYWEENGWSPLVRRT